MIPELEEIGSAPPVPQRKSSRLSAGLEHSLVDWAALGVATAKRSGQSRGARLSVAQEVKDDYARCVFRDGVVYTFPETRSVPSNAGESSATVQRCFEVVSMSSLSKTKKHVATERMAELKRFRVPATIQHMGLWRVPSDFPSGEQAAYQEGVPEEVDISAMFTAQVLTRDLRQWKFGRQSDTESCWTLEEPLLLAEKSWRLLYCSAVYVWCAVVYAASAF